MNNLQVENAKWNNAGHALWSTEVDAGNICPKCFAQGYISRLQKKLVANGDSDNDQIKVCYRCGYKLTF